MEKKALLIAAIISLLLSSAVAGTQLANLGKANPNPTAPWTVYVGDISPDGITEPPEISITSPKNNSIYIENSLNLTLTVSVEPSNANTTRYIQQITYRADWLPKNKTIYYWAPTTYKETTIEFSDDINLKDIPEGEHNIVVYAIEKGTYKKPTYEKSGLHPLIYAYSFNVNSSSSVTFNIDTIPPEISILPMQNKTYTDSNAPLNFTVNESVSQIWYVLDGKESITINENVTLKGLMNGEHNVTVYATDLAGHVGASKTVIFTIAKPEPFPTTLVIAAVATVAVAGVGLLVYFKKRKHQKEIVEVQ